ncbi:MAG TPA: GNAT family N-acetyltransferase [Propionibacteriaceae bacterium]
MDGGSDPAETGWLETGGLAFNGGMKRALTMADADAVLALFHEYDREFFGEGLADLEDLISGWQAPSFSFDNTLGHVDDAGELVAFGSLDVRGQLEVFCRAAWRRPLAAELADHFEQRARDNGLAAVDRYIAEGDTAGRAELVARGYEQHHTSWILRLDEATPIAGRVLPPGYAVRPFRDGDGPAVHAVIQDAFAAWDPDERSYEDWEAMTLNRPGGDPTIFRVATYEDEIIGAAVVFDSVDETWVAQLATHVDHRGRGVAQQLLASAYEAGRDRGLAFAGLSTDTRTGALDLYLRLGMRVLFTLENWSLSLDSSAAHPTG